MNNRLNNKSALIIYNTQYDRSARSFVEESLQYRKQYKHYYFFPVYSNRKANEAITREELDALLKENKIDKKYIDSYVMRNKSDIDGSAVLNTECYSQVVLDYAKHFRNHFVGVTYELPSTKKKWGSLSRQDRKVMRCSTNDGYPIGAISKVKIEPKLKTTKKHLQLASSLFDQTINNPVPPYQYLLLKGIKSAHAHIEFNKMSYDEYHQAVAKEIKIRQLKVVPIIREVEHHYEDPNSIAERLGNLFHAYANTQLVLTWRTHRALANQIAEKLYSNEDWELDECLSFIKNKLNTYRKTINPKGTFQGILLEIINMMQSIAIFQVGPQLKEYWQDKYDELLRLKETCQPDIAQCIDRIADEQIKLEKAGKPCLLLLKALEASIDTVQCINLAPGESNQVRLSQSIDHQYKVSQELGQHSWARILSGAMLCLLGLGLCAAMGASIYLTAGASLLLGGPILAHGLVLSAGMINTGLAVMGVMAMGSFVGSGLCLFAKQPAQKEMENLAEMVLGSHSNH